MTTFAVYAIGAAALIAIGLHGAVTRPHLVQKIISMNVISGGVFLLLIALAHRRGAGLTDPVPQALVLTGIVVAVSVTAFGIAIARRLHEQSGESALGEGNVE